VININRVYSDKLIFYLSLVNSCIIRIPVQYPRAMITNHPLLKKLSPDATVMNSQMRNLQYCLLDLIIGLYHGDDNVDPIIRVS
jgi:hypothetical protein